MKLGAWIVLGLTLLGALTLLGVTICDMRATSETISSVAYDEYRKQALELIRADTANLFSLSTGMLGALWAALVIPKDTRLQIRDYPNILLFAIANALIAGSLYFNLSFHDFLRACTGIWDRC